MNIIKYSGLNKLTGDEQGILKKIINEEFLRVQRLLKEMTDLKIDVKTHDKGGKRKMYVIGIRAIAPTHVFRYNVNEADIKKSPYYDIATASHKAIDALEQEMKHKLKSSTQNWKKAGLKKGAGSKID